MISGHVSADILYSMLSHPEVVVPRVKELESWQKRRPRHKSANVDWVDGHMSLPWYHQASKNGKLELLIKVG